MDYKVSEAASPGYAWALVAADESNRSVLISQQVERANRIFIQAGVQIGEAERQALARLSAKEHEDFEYELALALVSFGVHFSGIQSPLVAVDVTDFIYTDGLTQDALFRSMERVRSAFLTALWTINRRFSGKGPDQGFNFALVNKPSGTVH